MTDAMIELLSDGREWLEVQAGEPADVVEKMSDQQVFSAVGRRYIGGWDRFVADNA